MKKLGAILLAAIMAAAMAVTFAATPETSLANETNLANTEAAADTSGMNAENAADNVLRADRYAFNGAFKELFAQLDALRATCKANSAAVKGVNAQIKSALKSFKSSLTGLPYEERAAKANALTAALSPLHASVILIHADIKTIRINKAAQWVNYRLAVRGRNQAAAETALRSIISLKSSIIEKQNSLLAVKLQILTAIGSIH